MKGANFVVIQGWMKTGLGLKGNELLAYALIHGFCQMQNGAALSISYISEWLGTTYRSTVNTLNSLKEKDLIRTVGQPGKFSFYKVNTAKVSDAIQKTEEEERKEVEAMIAKKSGVKSVDGAGLKGFEKEEKKRAEKQRCEEDRKKDEEIRRIILETQWLQS